MIFAKLMSENDWTWVFVIVLIICVSFGCN
jgi:hypothetical protein